MCRVELYEPARGREPLREVGLAKIRSVEAVFVDVFDTVITRNLFRPADLFLRMRQKLSEAAELDGLSEVLSDYPRLRATAETLARSRSGLKGEVSFDNIYSTFSEITGLDEEQTSLLANHEIREEIASVAGIKTLAVLLKEVRSSGVRVAFLSDMYLPQEIIMEMLNDVGVFEPGDILYVSGTIGKKKSSGSMFRFVMNDLGLRPSQIVHIGDYLWSDYLIPRIKFGIQSLNSRIARNNTYESLWGEGCCCLLCSSLAGASRAARLARSGEGTVGEAALYNIGCNVIGPMLTVFILWLFQQAQKNGIRRLYFLSRDGEIMLEIAHVLAKRADVDIDLRYLSVSRASVLPALGSIAVDAYLDRVREDNVVMTLQVIADRLKLKVDLLQDLLNCKGIVQDDVGAPIAPETVNCIFFKLKTDPLLREMVQENTKESYCFLNNYLKQMDMFDGTPLAVVDLGWHGTIQDVIYACWGERFGNCGIAGYYFAIDRPGQHGNRKTGFFFEPGMDLSIMHQNLFRVLMEVMCAAPHGMAYRYSENSKGIVEPVLLPIEHSENIERVNIIRGGVRAFLKFLDVESTNVSDYSQIRPQVLSVLLKLFLYPNRDESSALGEMRFSADQASHGLNRIAPPFTFSTVLKYFLKRSYAGRSSISSWFFASFLRANWKVQILMCPIVFFLRIYISGPLFLRLLKLRFKDFANRSISIN